MPAGSRHRGQVRFVELVGSAGLFARAWSRLPCGLVAGVVEGDFPGDTPTPSEVTALLERVASLPVTRYPSPGGGVTWVEHGDDVAVLGIEHEGVAVQLTVAAWAAQARNSTKERRATALLNPAVLVKSRRAGLELAAPPGGRCASTPPQPQEAYFGARSGPMA